MDAPGQSRWLGVLVFVGLVYLVAGLVFGGLAGDAGSHEARVAWRLAAWVVSAAAFASHIGYELTRLRSSPTKTALRASLAAALGAFGLAVAAWIHGQSAAQHFPAWALAVWPAIVVLPVIGAVFVLVSAAKAGRATVRQNRAEARLRQFMRAFSSYVG